MDIKNVYRPGVLVCDMNDRLQSVAQKMQAEHVGALAVTDGTRIVGVISERDIARAVAIEPDVAIAVASAYLTADVQTANLADDTREVARRMLAADIRHLPVVGDHAVIGMVSMRDLLAVELYV